MSATAAGALGDASPENTLRSDRERVVRETPAAIARCRDLLDLAEIGLSGPDPEAALAQLCEVRRVCRAVLQLWPADHCG